MSDEETKHRYLIRTKRRNIYKIIEEKEEELFNSCWVEYPKTDDGLIAIRKVLSLTRNKKGLDYETAIRQIATEMGCETIEPRHRNFIEECIKTAIQRYVVQNDSGILRICDSSLANYTIEQLKNIILELAKEEWTYEDELYLALGRYFGFRGSLGGVKIEETISVLVKEGSLKSGKKARVYELGSEPVYNLIRLTVLKIMKDPVLFNSYFKERSFEDKVSWFKENLLVKIKEVNQIHKLVPIEALEDPLDQGLLEYIQKQVQFSMYYALLKERKVENDE